MKIRETINSNAELFFAVTYEDGGKIVVKKHDTHNYYDWSLDERFEFDTVTAYREWIATQSWIVPKKIRKVSDFRKVRA